MASRRKGPAKPSHPISGYFMPPDREEDFDIDEGEISDDEEFPDLSFAEFSGAVARSQPLKYGVVNFHEYKTRKVLKVKGSFQMDDPWWAATLKVQKGQVFYFTRGHPAYRLRTDDQVGPQGVVSLFMKSCKVVDEHKVAFYDYLRSRKLEDQVTFENLQDLLDAFGATNDENSQIMRAISVYITKGSGFLVWESLQHRDLFEILPQLLPRKFKDIIMRSKGDEDLLPNLRQILENEPWVMGFSRVFSKRKIGLKSCEATLQAFIDSGLIEKLTPVQKDALYVYNALKSACRGFGHTYVIDRLFRRSKQFSEDPIGDWTRAYAFLRKEDIIVTEAKGEDLAVFLYTFWYAETNIAGGLKCLWRKHEHDPWTFEIDFTDPLFEETVQDADQQKAAELISKQPVVALSGRGGCGKTSVVSKVFQFAQRLLYKEEAERYSQSQFDGDDIDDLTLTQTAAKLEGGENTEQSDEAEELCDLSKSQLDDSLPSDPFPETPPPKKSQSGQIPNGATDPPPQSEEKPGADEPVILLTAPTGKAAHLLGKRTKLPAFTLHQVTFSYNSWRNAPVIPDGPPPKWKFRFVKVLVVDESSLVSVSIFSWLLHALISESQLQKVVLLGDICQLPSIEPGNFLPDAYSSLHRIGCSVLLKTNHRAESQRIVENAGLIAQKNYPVIEPDKHFHQVTLPEQGNVSNEDDDLVLQTSEAIKKLLVNDKPPLGGHKLSQFVAFRRKDCEAINEACCLHYSKHPTKDPKGHTWFQVGDKVCCTKNATVVDQLKSEASRGGKNKEKDATVRLCNGEIFYIIGDVEIQARGKTQRYLTLTNGAELPEELQEVKVDYRVLRRECKLKHAWARTIHTYQGSESNTVVYVVGSAGGQTWQHVYTAVTRGRKQVILVTRQSQLEASICKDPTVRQTSLKERLCEIIQQLSKDKKPHQPQGAPNPQVGGPNPAPQFVTARSMLPGTSTSNHTASSNLNDSDMEALQNLAAMASNSADNSQTFSDWGDGDMEAINDLEQTVLGHNQQAVNGGEQGHKNKLYPDLSIELALELEEEIKAEMNAAGNPDLQNGSRSSQGQRKDKLYPDLSVELALDLEEEIQAEMNQAGNRTSQNGSRSQSRTNQGHNNRLDPELSMGDALNLLREAENKSSKPLKPTDAKRAAKNLFGSREGGTTNHGRKTIQNDFLTEDSFYSGASTSNNSTPPHRPANCSTSAPSTPPRAPPGGAGSEPTSPNKRRLEFSDQKNGKRRMLVEGPVTDSFISPMRRTLDGISLVDSSKEGQD